MREGGCKKEKERRERTTNKRETERERLQTGP